MPSRMHLNRGLLVSATSMVWTLIASTISVILGITSNSVVLTAFGATGLLDAAGSLALIIHFRHAIKHDTFSEGRERVALLIVTVGLITVALATLIVSSYRLVQGTASGHSEVGLVLAAASVVVLSTLSVVKTRTGKALPSPALVADGMLSLTGGLLAAITVAGSFLTSAGINWADPIAAMLIAVGALVIVVLMRRGEELD